LCIFFFNLKTIIMRSILYIIAVILVIGWLLGFFVYSATGLIHILLVLAVISLLLALIGGRGTP
ncbi:MAG TPA: lmo0937 family membrane protein, partial [Parafilimonas sp.]|nr:lmo0937 family membrane protein [Parafilimonas sp.]